MDGKRLLQIVTETWLTQSKCVLERQRKDLEGIDFSWYKIVLVNRVCVTPCKIYFPNIIDSLMPVRPCLVSLDIYLIVRMKRGSASRSALKPFSAIFGSKGVVGKDSLPVPHFQKLVCLLLTAKEGKYRKAHHKRRKKIWWHKPVIQVLYHVMIQRGRNEEAQFGGRVVFLEAYRKLCFIARPAFWKVENCCVKWLSTQSVSSCYLR